MLLCLSLLAKSNTLLNNEDDSGDKGGKVTGAIIDRTTKKPMSYANVAIYTLQDSGLISGGITNDDGRFEISNLKFGDFYLEAQFIGFDKTSISNISLDRKNSSVDIGMIELSPSSIELNEVNVVADKALVEYKLDKKVVNVSQVLSAIGGTAVDVLENTPSIQVDIEGNVSLRGSGNFTVLIDGRPSILSGSDALRQIPSSAIENIEIITNPSAKYEPDRTAGIINLVMKKNSMNGLNGIVNTSLGTGDKYRSDFMLNYKLENVNWFFGADWRDENNKGEITLERETYYNDTTEFVKIKGDRNRIRGGYSIKGGADWHLSKRSTLTLSGEFGNSNGESGGGGTNENYTTPTSEHIYSVTEEVSERNTDFYTLNMNFQHKFNDEGHNVDASIFYSDESGTDTDIEGELLANENFVPGSEYLSRISTLETEEEQDIRMKLDYTYPFSKTGRLEAGYQGRLEDETEALEFRDYAQGSDLWIINEEYTSSTDFKRHIHAAYATYSNKLGRIQFMGGLRGELTQREIMNSQAAQASKLDRFDVFPTAHLSYPLGKSTDLTTSYSRRINRPGGRDLDPTPTYYNRYTIRYGNPDLEPEYTNSFEIGAMKRFGESRSFITADLFRRVTNNKIQRLEKQGDNDVFYLYTDNFDKDYSTGIEVSGNLNYKEWLILNASMNVFKYKLTGELDNESIDTRSTNWGGRLNSTFKLAENSRLQVTSFFVGPSTSAQGETGSMFFTNLSYRHEFLKKKLSATLSLRDPFGTAKYERKSYDDSFKSWFRMQREPRVLFLTLSYKINNFKEERSSEGGGGRGMDMDAGEF